MRTNPSSSDSLFPSVFLYGFPQHILEFLEAVDSCTPGSGNSFEIKLLQWGSVRFKQKACQIESCETLCSYAHFPKCTGVQRWLYELFCFLILQTNISCVTFLVNSHTINTPEERPFLTVRHYPHLFSSPCQHNKDIERHRVLGEKTGRVFQEKGTMAIICTAFEAISNS